MKTISCGLSAAILFLLVAGGMSNAQTTSERSKATPGVRSDPSKPTVTAPAKPADSIKSASKGQGQGDAEVKSVEPPVGSLAGAGGGPEKQAAAQGAAKVDEKKSEQATTQDSSGKKLDVSPDPLRDALFRYLIGGAVALAAIALFLLLPLALWSMFGRYGRSFAFKSHWGGFGGGVGGWSLSPPATLLIAACLLASLAVLLLLETAQQTDPLRHAQVDANKPTPESGKTPETER